MKTQSTNNDSADNPTSVQKVSKHSPHFGHLSPTNIDYWKGRITLPGYSQGGVKKTGALYVVKIQYAGRRETFNLRLSNKDAAARRARDIYLALMTRGWDDALARFKPKPEKKPAEVLTVGKYLDLVAATGLISAVSMISYRAKMRTLVGMISKVGSGRAKGVKRLEWRVKIDALPLAALNAEAIERCRLLRQAQYAHDPAQLEKFKHTMDSILRNGRALFRKKIRETLAKSGFVLPPSPFADVNLCTRGKSSFRYVSTFSVDAIIRAAVRELSTKQPRLFLIFVLAVVLGLRRNEIDKLKWTAVAWEEKELRVFKGDFFSPKSATSHRRLALDEATLRILRHHFDSKTDDWVLPSANKAKINVTYRHYRLENEFTQLCTWLRPQGVTAQKPLHTLRKESGSRINDKFGIIAAQNFLGHASPEVTWTYYVSAGAPKPTGFGAIIEEAGLVMPETDGQKS